MVVGAVRLCVKGLFGMLSISSRETRLTQLVAD
jgi:hypothetical protein